jgi:hypothetical protein
LNLALCGSLVFADEAAEDGPELDPLLGEVDSVIAGSRRVQLAAVMGIRPF